MEDEYESHLQPSNVVIDFEQAIHETTVSAFPHTKIVGYRFHLAQAW